MMALTLSLATNVAKSEHHDKWLALAVVIAIIFLLMVGTVLVQWLNRFFVKWLERVLSPQEKNSSSWTHQMTAQPSAHSSSSHHNQSLLH